MKFVTNRSDLDFLQGHGNGFYSYSDLNRVEGNVRTLCLLAAQVGVTIDLTTKTDWGTPAHFDAAAWPTDVQMARYLQNVYDLCAALDVRPELPTSMQLLTVAGANNIEKALKEVYEEIQRRIPQ